MVRSLPFPYCRNRAEGSGQAQAPAPGPGHLRRPRGGFAWHVNLNGQSVEGKALCPLFSSRHLSLWKPRAYRYTPVGRVGIRFLNLFLITLPRVSLHSQTRWLCILQALQLDYRRSFPRTVERWTEA